MKERESIVDRVRKLLRLATHNASAGEAANALSAAQALMREYGISQSEAVLEAAAAGRVEQTQHERAGSLPTWEFLLASSVAEACDCACVRVTSSLGRTRIVFYGLGQDAACALALFQELRKTAMRQSRRLYGQSWTASHGNFALGFACIIFQRVHDSAPQLDEATRSLVLVKNAAVAAQVEGIPDAKLRMPCVADRSAYAMGRIEGAKQSLGRNGLPNHICPPALFCGSREGTE